MKTCTVLTSKSTSACQSLHVEHMAGHVKADNAVNNTEMKQPAKAVQLHRQVLALLAAVA